MTSRFLVYAVLWLAAGMAQAAPIANSVSDFSSVQGQDGWFYGFFNQGVDGSTAYTTAAFTQFETFGVVEAGSWGATDAQVGAQNNDYLGLASATGHPTGLAPPDIQDRIIWAVRRYQSEVAGDVDIKIDLRKINPNPSGGITGRVFVDGVEVYTQFVAFDDLIGYQTTIVRNVALNSLIEFAIDPLGVATSRGDGIYSPRSDGTHFSAVISPHEAAVPVAPTLLLMTGGLIGLIASRRRRRG